MEDGPGTKAAAACGVRCQWAGHHQTRHHSYAHPTYGTLQLPRPPVATYIGDTRAQLSALRTMTALCLHLSASASCYIGMPGCTSYLGSYLATGSPMVYVCDPAMRWLCSCREPVLRWGRPQPTPPGGAYIGAIICSLCPCYQPCSKRPALWPYICSSLAGKGRASFLPSPSLVGTPLSGWSADLPAYRAAPRRAAHLQQQPEVDACNAHARYTGRGRCTDCRFPCRAYQHPVCPRAA